MVHETIDTQDRVVKCIFCAQPIPVSPRLASLSVVPKDDAERDAQQRRSQVVIQRCPKCNHEAHYRRGDIIAAGAVTAPWAGDTLKAFRKAAS